MNQEKRKSAALISVSNREGLPEFAAALHECGYLLIASSGTRKFLMDSGLPVTSIEEYTGQQEFLDGRVKTLHPKIHGGLLADRSKPSHLQQLEDQGILPIDVAVVNTYPFIEGLPSKWKDPAAMTELIDIGGPTMMRAAAKNFRSVFVVTDPADYSRVAQALRTSAGEPTALLGLRAELASKVFSTMARYDLEVARYLASVQTVADGSLAAPDENPADTLLTPVSGFVGQVKQRLRYGENPHQRAALYEPVGTAAGSSAWKQHQGKELSYNNMLDCHAALNLLATLESFEPAVGIIKHLNPCGVAYGTTLVDALRRAKQCDPRSHFGGIIVCNGIIDKALAEEIAEDFAEVVLAPNATPEALEVFSRKKNLRVITVEGSLRSKFEVRLTHLGVLVQESDQIPHPVRSAQVMTEKKPDDAMLRNLELAWRCSTLVGSNAVVVVRDGMLVGVGAGQMSRIDATEIALSKARVHGHSLMGAVAASDAFFPFPDSVETLAKAGITAVIAPRGAMRDEEVVKTADANGVALLFANERHFRH